MQYREQSRCVLWLCFIFRLEMYRGWKPSCIPDSLIWVLYNFMLYFPHYIVLTRRLNSISRELRIEDVMCVSSVYLSGQDHCLDAHKSLWNKKQTLLCSNMDIKFSSHLNTWTYLSVYSAQLSLMLLNLSVSLWVHVRLKWSRSDNNITGLDQDFLEGEYTGATNKKLAWV